MKHTTKTKHTQGPWWRDDDGFIAAGHNDTYLTIADADCSHDIDIAEREANKSLICSAPELLEALEGLMRQAVKEIEKNGLADNNPLWAYIDDASDVITRAKGELS